MGPVVLPFNRAGCDTLDDVLLAGKVEDDHRNDAQQNQCHGRAEVDRAVASLQILDVDRDRPVLVDIQHQIGQQIVIPDPHDFQNAHRDHRRLQHREDHREVGSYRAAAVNGRRFLNLQRNGLDKTHEHEDRKPSAKAQIDDGDRPGRVQVQAVRGLGEREHDHLEGHHHGEDTEVIDHLAEERVHPCDVPGRHGGEEDNERGGQHRDDDTVLDAVPERIVAECHALDEVLEACPHLPDRDGEGVGLDKGVDLEGVDDHRQNRQHVDDADHSQYDGQNCFIAPFGRDAFLFVHYCCTSLLRV